MPLLSFRTQYKTKQKQIKMSKIKNDSKEIVTNTPDNGLNRSGNAAVKVIEHSQFAKSVLQQKKEYIPVAAHFSNYGNLRKELISPILPSGTSGRQRLYSIIRTIETHGQHFNEGRLIKLLSTMSSHILAFHRNAMRFSNELADYSKFGPLNYIRYVSKVTKMMNGLQRAKGKVEYNTTNDYMLMLLMSTYVDVIIDFIGTEGDKLKDKFTIATITEETLASLKEVNGSDWYGNPEIHKDYSLLFRVLSNEVLGRLTARVGASLDVPDNLKPTFLMLSETIISNINDMALTMASTVVDQIAMGRQSNVDDSQLPETNLIEKSLERLAEKATFLDIYTLALTACISKAGDVGGSRGVTEGISKETLEYLQSTSANTDKGGNLLVAKLKALGSDVETDTDTDVARFVGGDASKYPAAIRMIREFILNLSAEDDVSFAFDAAKAMYDSVTDTFGIGDKTERLSGFFVSMGGSLSSLLNSGEALEKNKLLQYVGVEGKDRNAALEELSNHIDQVIEGRDAVAAYYADMETAGTEAVKNVSHLINEYDLLCATLSAQGSKTTAANTISAFLSSEVWKRSGAQKLYSAAYSYIDKATDADSLMQQMVIDEKVINAFNNSVFNDFATLRSGGTIFPGHEFALGTNLVVTYEGSIKITGLANGQFTLNGYKGYQDIYNLVICETRDPDTLKRLSSIYNVKLQQCLSDPDVLRGITNASSSPMSGGYNFSREIMDVALSRLQSIESAIRTEIACLKYSIKSNIDQYLLANYDMLRALDIAIKGRELNFYSDTGVERVREMIAESKSLIRAMNGDLNIAEAEIKDDEFGAGLAPITIENSHDIATNLDTLLSFFNQKSNRIWYQDLLRNIGALVTRLDQGKADGKNFSYFIDLDTKLYSAEYSALTKFRDQLERLDVDVLANVLPSEGMIDEVRDTTHRMYTSANFLYAIDLASTFSGQKIGFFGSPSKIIGSVRALPAGLDRMNIMPNHVVDLLTRKINSSLTERYLSHEDVEDRLNKLYLLKGSNTSAMMKLGTGYGELAEYGILNVYHDKIAYSEKNALAQVLEEIGLHPDVFLMNYEVENFVAYVQNLSRFGNFPLRLTSVGIELLGDANIELSENSTSPFMRPQSSEFKIGDVVRVKSSALRSSQEMAGAVYHVSFYTRGADVLNLLNADIIEYRSGTKPMLMALSPRDGLREFYTHQDELTMVEGSIAADVRYDLSGGQALNVCISVAEALYEKIFSTSVGGISKNAIGKDDSNSPGEDDNNED